MHQEKRRPPTGDRRPFEDVSLRRSDDLEDNHPQSKKQGPDRPRRNLACGHRTLGPGERAAISALRRQRQVQRVHGLGSRALYELLIEIGAEFGITAFIEQKIERYAALDPEAVRLAGGDRFPAPPIHEVSP